MEAGGDTRRRVAVIGAAAMALVVGVAFPVGGQETLGFLQPLMGFLSSQSGIDLEADLAREPGANAVAADPANDFEHVTGELPRLTPGYIDIREGTLFEIDPGAAALFGPTNTAALWAPTGPREIAPPDDPPFFTYTTNLPKDGSQFEGGALLFSIRAREAVPPRPDEVCDYAVWVHDPSREVVFQNLPQFPADPGTGTNLAFGVRLTPEGGGVPVAFSLAIDDEGMFQPSNTDTRAIVIGDTVGLFVPRQGLGELASVNYHAVCSGEGSAIDPSSSGADQTGLAPMALSDAGAIAIMETPITATPTVAATSTTSRQTATTASTNPVTTSDRGLAVWAPVVAATALLGAIAYWLFARKRNPEERAFAAWRKAERALASAEGEAELLVIACLDSQAVLEELEHERDDLCRVWPPACLEEEDDTATSTHDQHFRRMALGELWVDYKEGKIGAEEVEARWRQVNTPEFQTRMRETDAAYGETLAQLDVEVASARAEMEQACPPAAAATTRMETARQAVFVARRAYLETLETVPPPHPSTWLLGDCDDTAEKRLAPDGPTEHLRVNVGFMVTVGRFVGRERNLERGERLILEMEGLLHELDLIFRVNRAREGAIHTGWTGHEYEPGVYWVTGIGIRRGESDEGLPPGEAERPTRSTGSEAGLTDLPATIGDHASSKIAGWITEFETMTMQRTFFHQLITTRPYTLWECREEVWAPGERVWRVEVGEPQRTRGEIRWFSVDSPGRRAQFETEINRLAWVATGVVTRDLRRLLRWRADHSPETQTRS